MLLPFDRYEFLLKKATGEAESHSKETCEKQEKEGTKDKQENHKLSAKERRGVDDEICSCFPVEKRSEVDKILISINSSNCVSYDDHGMLSFNGQPIYGMHASDLLHRMIDVGQLHPISDESKEKQQTIIHTAPDITADVTRHNWIKRWRPLH